MIRRWRDVSHTNITATAAAAATPYSPHTRNRTQRLRARARTITGFCTTAAAAADITRLKCCPYCPHYRVPTTHRSADSRLLQQQPPIETTVVRHRTTHAHTHTHTVHRHRTVGAGWEAVILISNY